MCLKRVTFVQQKAPHMKTYSIGIDIGGTNTVIGLVARDGRVLLREQLKTTDYPTPELYADAMQEVISRLLAQQDADGCAGVGIGAPNASYFTGEIIDAANLPWKGRIALKSMLEERTGLPVILTNDAKAAAMGEMIYGAARGMKDFMVITLGTGVGSGIVCNGRLVYGHDGLAGELGHTIVQRGGRDCGCGRKGCLETYCSATGIVRTAREVLKASDEDSLLRQIPEKELTSKAICEAALAGDRLSREIYSTTGRILGEALANFTVFSSPEAIILFGGMSQAGELLMEPVRKALSENILHVYNTRLLSSAIEGQNAAILGASALAWE